MKSLAEINKERTKWQHETFEKWKASGGRGIIVAATGVGKTRIPTYYAIPRMNMKQPTFTTKVVVPKRFLREDWEKRGGHIDKCGLRNVETWVVNSFIRLRHECDLLVLDECHRYANEDAEFFSTVLKVCKFKMLLALTARLSPEQEAFLRQFKIPVIERLSTKDAERRGFISSYTVFNLPVQLSDEDRAEADRLEENFAIYKNKLGSFRAFDEAMAIVPDGLFPKKDGYDWREPRAVAYARNMGWSGVSLQEALVNYRNRQNAPRGTKKNYSIWEDENDNHEFTPTKVYHYAVSYMKAMKERQDYLHLSIGKIEMTKKILEVFNQKAIVFSQRTAFADEIARLLGNNCAAFHSKLESQPIKKNGQYICYMSGAKKGKPKVFGATLLQKMILEDFKNNKLKYLSTVVSLDEGLDVPDVSLAIIVSATSKEGQNTQRIGRVVRAEEGKHAIIINLYIPDTQDEKWLRDRQREDKPAIYVNSIDEILNYNSDAKIETTVIGNDPEWTIEL